jgi:hypothetical protein
LFSSFRYQGAMAETRRPHLSLQWEKNQPVFAVSVDMLLSLTLHEGYVKYPSRSLFRRAIKQLINRECAIPKLRDRMDDR